MRKSIQEYQLQRDTQNRLDKLMSKSQMLRKRFRSASSSSRKKRDGALDKSERSFLDNDTGTSASPLKGTQSKYASPEKAMIRKDLGQEYSVCNDGNMQMITQKFDLIDSSMFR
jgi:hypothetical protein